MGGRHLEPVQLVVRGHPAGLPPGHSRLLRHQGHLGGLCHRVTRAGAWVGGGGFYHRVTRAGAWVGGGGALPPRHSCRRVGGGWGGFATASLVQARGWGVGGLCHRVTRAGAWRAGTLLLLVLLQAGLHVCLCPQPTAAAPALRRLTVISPCLCPATATPAGLHYHVARYQLCYCRYCCRLASSTMWSATWTGTRRFCGPRR